MVNIKKIYVPLAVGDAKSECDLSETPHMVVETIDDQIKVEHIAKVWQDYTAAEIEALLPPKK